VEQLDGMLERWTAEGIITPDQARDIREHELRQSGSARAGPAVAEVIGYVGAACALAAIGLVASRIWPDLGLPAKIGLLVAVTGLLGAAGTWAHRTGEGVSGRLASVLWFGSAAALAWLADVVFNQGLELDEGRFGWLLVGGASTLYAALLYAKRRSSPQLLALAGAVVMLCAGVSDALGGHEQFGGPLWLTGAAWIGLTRRGLLVPLRAAYGLGAAAVLVGAELQAAEFFVGPQGWALALGLASAAALVSLSVAFRQMVLLGFGAVGLFAFLAQITEEYLADSLGGPLALLATGICLLLVALLAARLARRVGD
jgi:hypothetical protein